MALAPDPDHRRLLHHPLLCNPEEYIGDPEDAGPVVSLISGSIVQTVGRPAPGASGEEATDSDMQVRVGRGSVPR